MAFSKVSELADLNEQALGEQIAEVKRQLFELRLQKATKQTVKPHQFKHASHRLAQLLTLERQLQLNAQAPSDS